MTQILLNGLDVIAGFDTGNGIRMPQIVESGLVITEASNHGFEVLVNGVHPQMLSVCLRKYETIFVPSVSKEFPIPFLFCFHFP